MCQFSCIFFVSVGLCCSERCHWNIHATLSTNLCKRRNLITFVDFDETYHIAQIFCAHCAICVLAVSFRAFVIRCQYCSKAIETEGFLCKLMDFCFVHTVFFFFHLISSQLAIIHVAKILATMQNAMFHVFFKPQSFSFRFFFLFAFNMRIIH